MKDGITASARAPLAGFPFPRVDGVPLPVAFLNVETREEQEAGGSKFNRGEAEYVIGSVKDLLSGGLEPMEVGVVTPYAAQVRYLRSGLRRALGFETARLIECCSVDGFQGREKEAIIFSTVRNNNGGHVGFLADWCRTNVAITRARRGLIVIGNARTLKCEQRSWAPWLRWASAVGAICGQAPSGIYDVEATRSLADGSKAFEAHVMSIHRDKMRERRARKTALMSGGGAAAAAAAAAEHEHERARQKESEAMERERERGRAAAAIAAASSAASLPRISRFGAPSSGGAVAVHRGPRDGVRERERGGEDTEGRSRDRDDRGAGRRYDDRHRDEDRRGGRGRDARDWRDRDRDRTREGDRKATDRRWERPVRDGERYDNRNKGGDKRESERERYRARSRSRSPPRHR